MQQKYTQYVYSAICKKSESCYGFKINPKTEQVCSPEHMII